MDAAWNGDEQLLMDILIRTWQIAYCVSSNFSFVFRMFSNFYDEVTVSMLNLLKFFYYSILPDFIQARDG